MKKLILLTAVAAGLISADARPATVITTDGSKYEGAILSETADTVRLKLPAGELILPRENIRELLRDEPAGDVYQKQRKALDPKDAHGHYELARWCKVSGLGDEARELFAKTIALEPDHEGAHKALGHQLVDGAWKEPVTQPAEPAKPAKLTREQWEQYAEAYRKGHEAALAGDFKASAGHFEQAVKINPDSQRALEFLATAYLNIDDPEYHPKAERAVKAAMKNAVDNLQFRRGLAKVLAKQKKFDEAKALTDELLKKDPDDVLTLTVLGFVCFEREKYQDALDAYRKADGVYRKNELFNGEVNYAIANCHEKLKDYDKAVDILLDMRKMDVYNLEVHYRLGKLNLAKGASEQAKQHFEDYWWLSDETDDHWEEVCKLLDKPAAPKKDEPGKKADAPRAEDKKAPGEKPDDEPKK